TAEQDDSQFVQCLRIDLALELNDGIQRHPVLAPAPRVELRRTGCPQTDIGVSPHHSEQKPNLLLTLVMAARIAPDEIAWHVITQPVSCPPQNTHVFRQQAYFFVQLAVHSLYRALTVLDAALWKLPRMFSYTLAPENLVL